jgi:hypothetical protein
MRDNQMDGTPIAAALGGERSENTIASEFHAGIGSKRRI